MLIHGVCPDQRTWIPLFLLCYFHHKKDSDSLRSKNQAHTLDSIIVGRSPTSNAILVYNPCNQHYYKPDSYRLDPYRLPSLVYPTIVCNGSLFISLHRDDSSPISKPYPPGTQVKDFNKSTNVVRSDTVMDIPMDATLSQHYLIQFDDATTKSVPVADMSSLIPKPLADVSDSTHLLLPFLRLNSKITFEHDGQYHKGYITQSPDGVYCFSYKLHMNTKQEDWGVPLPHLPTTWHDLCTDRGSGG
jgi:hypothetical protein